MNCFTVLMGQKALKFMYVHTPLIVQHIVKEHLRANAKPSETTVNLLSTQWLHVRLYLINGQNK